MSHLIDKDALVAEIEKLQSEIAKEKKSHEGLSMWYNGINHGFNLTKDILNTLEVKEVDLEKEVDKIMPRFLNHITCREEEIKFAKHFFELGLKAKEK